LSSLDLKQEKFINEQLKALDENFRSFVASSCALEKLPIEMKTIELNSQVFVKELAMKKVPHALTVTFKMVPKSNGVEYFLQPLNPILSNERLPCQLGTYKCIFIGYLLKQFGNFIVGTSETRNSNAQNLFLKGIEKEKEFIEDLSTAHSMIHTPNQKKIDLKTFLQNDVSKSLPSI